MPIRFETRADAYQHMDDLYEANAVVILCRGLWGDPDIPTKTFALEEHADGHVYVACYTRLGGPVYVELSCTGTRILDLEERPKCSHYRRGATL
jgi:hypothetical protein